LGGEGYAPLEFETAARNEMGGLKQERESENHRNLNDKNSSGAPG
jgi:hypothetical protein